MLCAVYFDGQLRPGWSRSDPTIGVDNPPRPKTDGFAPWTEEDIAAYETRWPIGTRQRVWLDVLVYTGLRRGDAVRFGRPACSQRRSAPSRRRRPGTEVTLPILPVLSRTLEAGPCGDLTFIAGENGHPLTKELFGNLFRKACRAAGLQRRSAHGLRKAAATRAANAGATVAELEAIFGWQRRDDGCALYPRRRSSPIIARRDAQACERPMNKRYPHLSGKLPAPC